MDSFLNCSKCGISTPSNAGIISVICWRCTTRATLNTSEDEAVEKIQIEKKVVKKRKRKGIKCVVTKKLVKRSTKLCKECEYKSGCELFMDRSEK